MTVESVASIETHTLYRMYDVNARLLYVGITANVPARFHAHRGGQFWWHDVAEIRLTHYADRDALEAAELVAIRTEGPVYNVASRTDPKPSKRRTPQRTIAIDDDDWEALGADARRVGSERAAVLRACINWYNRKPGAKLPPRPGE